MKDKLEDITLSASGQIAKQYIYWEHNGEKFKRPYVVPTDPQTDEQLIQRLKFLIASFKWGELTENEKIFYNNKAKVSGKAQTGYNYYLSETIKEISKMVKSIQGGNTACGQGYTNITINAVDVNKSVIMSPDCASAYWDGSQPRMWGVQAYALTSPTNMQVYCSVQPGMPNFQFNWYIIEFF